MAKYFKPAFRQEVAELVVDKNYSIQEAAETMRRLGIESCQPPKHHYKPASKSHSHIENHLNR